MVRLIYLSDFTESYPFRLLKGILSYSKGQTPWVVCRMPTFFRKEKGMKSLLEWAVKWKADAIIGQFEPQDDLSLFQQNGILAIAQDYEERFPNIANITGNYLEQGAEAADFFVSKGFHHFAFYGYSHSVWSRERKEGFQQKLQAFGYDHIEVYERQSLTNLWYYQSSPLQKWLERLPPQTALLACDDTRANVILEVCRLIGKKVPTDLAVLGIDNDELTCSLSYPSLSSINLDVESAGYDVAKYITEHLANPAAPVHDINVCTMGIIERQSSEIFCTNNKYILRVMEYIHQHYSEALPVSTLLSLVPMSRRLFEETFLKETGHTIHQYIIELRLRRMKQLLITTDRSISDLALETGLSDARNVARIFNTHLGITPQQYRNQHSKKNNK